MEDDRDDENARKQTKVDDDDLLFLSIVERQQEGDVDRVELDLGLLDLDAHLDLGDDDAEDDDDNDDSPTLK